MPSVDKGADRRPSAPSFVASAGPGYITLRVSPSIAELLTLYLAREGFTAEAAELDAAMCEAYEMQARAVRSTLEPS